MRFAAGLLLGLLLAGPTVEHHYHVTETNRLRMNLEAEPVQVEVIGNSWEAVDGQEDCTIQLLPGGYGGTWTAEDVLDLLDRAYAEFDGPCDMLEASR